LLGTGEIAKAENHQNEIEYNCDGIILNVISRSHRYLSKQFGSVNDAENEGAKKYARSRIDDE